MYDTILVYICTHVRIHIHIKKKKKKREKKGSGPFLEAGPSQLSLFLSRGPVRPAQPTRCSPYPLGRAEGGSRSLASAATSLACVAASSRAALPSSAATHAPNRAGPAASRPPSPYPRPHLGLPERGAVLFFFSLSPPLPRARAPPPSSLPIPFKSGSYLSLNKEIRILFPNPNHPASISSIRSLRREPRPPI